MRWRTSASGTRCLTNDRGALPLRKPGTLTYLRVLAVGAVHGQDDFVRFHFNREGDLTRVKRLFGYLHDGRATPVCYL